MYNEQDLKTIWYAFKGGMKLYQLSQLMGVTQDEAENMLIAAREMFTGQRKEKDAQKERRPYFRSPIIPEKINQPIVRPKAKYDNKSPEERINEYLNSDF